MSAPRSPTETKAVPSGGRPIVSTVSAQTADSRVWGVTPLGGRAQIVWWARPRVAPESLAIAAPGSGPFSGNDGRARRAKTRRVDCSTVLIPDCRVAPTAREDDWHQRARFRFAYQHWPRLQRRS